MESDNHESRDERITNSPKPLQQTTAIQTLPEEIILQILSKLPFSSLIRFKCVCKAWKELSQHQYLSHLYNNNNQCLMLYSHDNPSKDRLCFVDFNSNCSDEDNSLKEIEIPFGSSSSSSALKLNAIGSCNGLLCLSSPDHNDQYIFNPFTTECIELPKTSHSRVQWAVFGFGFHPKTKEYKVVKLIYYRPREMFGLSPIFIGRSEVQVFTLGSRSSWRSLGSAPHVVKPSTGKNVLVYGRLHYLSDLYKYRQDSDILSFDLEDEQFRFVARPDSVCIRWSDHLLVLKGCLSVASYASNREELEIWVQKEYDVEASWVKWLNIATRSHVPKALSEEGDNDKVSYFRRWSDDHRVLCEFKNGEILLEYESRALVVYDPSNGSFKDVEFQGMPRLFHSVLHLGNLNQIDAIVGSNF